MRHPNDSLNSSTPERERERERENVAQCLWKWDCLFILSAFVFAGLAYTGLVEISASGVIIDSDLQTYAQGMAAAARPELFTLDPVLGHATPANSIPNVERMLASVLSPEDNWGLGLLRAGAIAVFFFFIAWYCLGRWLYTSPALASLLTVCCSITIWVGWGTFWGVLHSDPIPRIFFGALLPLLLWLAITAITVASLRPMAMLLAGLLMYVHGVSALNTGAMIFTTFMLFRAPRQSWTAHGFNLLVCLAFFFIPVLSFLWPSLFQERQFTSYELNTFRQLMELRWHQDFSDFSWRILNFLSPCNAVLPVLLGGVVGWLVTYRRGNTPREKSLCRLIPGCVIGLTLAVTFCWLEVNYAQQFGRLPMGHELVRGLRLLIPLAWLLIVAGIGCCITGTLPRRLIFGTALCLSFFFAQDRQLMCAEYTFTRLTGIHLPLSPHGELARSEAANFLVLMQKVKSVVPQGELIYSPEELMPIRFVAQRPLAYTFKDGYVYFYNKDAEGSQHWLKMHELASSGPKGWLEAWRKSNATWILLAAPHATELANITNFKIILEKNGYILASREESRCP